MAKVPKQRDQPPTVWPSHAQHCANTHDRRRNRRSSCLSERGGRRPCFPGAVAAAVSRGRLSQTTSLTSRARVCVCGRALACVFCLQRLFPARHASGSATRISRRGSRRPRGWAASGARSGLRATASSTPSPRFSSSMLSSERLGLDHFPFLLILLFKDACVPHASCAHRLAPSVHGTLASRLSHPPSLPVLPSLPASPVARPLVCLPAVFGGPAGNDEHGGEPGHGHQPGQGRPAGAPLSGRGEDHPALQRQRRRRRRRRQAGRPTAARRSLQSPGTQSTHLSQC